MENLEQFFKLAGGIIAVGMVVYLAGKARQIVEFLRENVAEMREEAKAFRQTIIEHGERIADLEGRARSKRK